MRVPSVIVITVAALSLGATARGGTGVTTDKGYPAYEAQQAAIKALNDAGTQPLAGYALSKAQCWLDVSFHEFTRNDRSAFPREAWEQSHRITDELKASGQSSSALETPLVNGAARLRPDLWNRLGELKGADGARCAAQLIACAEVELVHAGNEYRQIGWRHARPYVQIVEDRVEEAAAAGHRCAAAPQPAPAAAAAAAPAPAPGAPPEQIERVALSAEALFHFDRRAPGDLLPQGRAQLAALAQRLDASYVSISSITLVGHTDRLGGAAYNQRLSLDRAESVRAYLLAQGVHAPMTTRGVGAAEPVVGCEGERQRAALRECLQPNRRVEVTITGVRR